jgi:hypothetical protein
MRERDALVCLCEFVRAHVSAGSSLLLESVVIVVDVRVASARSFCEMCESD